MKAELTYISASCNRTPNICDWGNNGLICYGTCNSVIVFDPKFPGTPKNSTTLIGHTKRVNAVGWIKQQDGSLETEIVSASTDCTAIIWSFMNDEYKKTVLKGHEDGVNLVQALYTDVSSKNSLIVLTASTDSTVRIWRRDSFGGDASNIQVLKFDRGLALALSLTFLPLSNILLFACARDNSKVQLYAQFKEDETESFKLVETLKGHENWVRGLDFTTDDKGNVYLASCAQDTFIRIWCISPTTESSQNKTLIDMLSSHNMRAMETHFSVTGDKDARYFTVHLESVLCGHEGWVYEVRWAPKIRNNDGTTTQPMKILSSSLDKTMLIWALDDSAGVWMETMRVGEVGGNTLGFYGSKFSPDGQSIIGHGYLGSFHLWNYSGESNIWEPGVIVGGHSGEVIDFAWEPQGTFLMSVSQDQTTRIHAPWTRNNKVSWHELARPQVHGYDMSCIAILSRYKFVSGAEEKIVRAFKAPSNFVLNFRNICSVADDAEGDQIISGSTEGPKGATVPSLGLSNKAVYDSTSETDSNVKGKEMYPEDSYFHELKLDAPPTEENLLQNTLWPEVQKLYGHGYEVFSLAASSDGNLVASACKATTPEHATIILWDTDTWQQKQKLHSHTLTVTQIMFSPDNNKILSVSRDRRWTIFEKNLETNEYDLVATTDKKNGIHSRIIWCCAWSPDSRYFVTGSRDGKVGIWWRNEGKQPVPGDSLGSYEAAGLPLELKGESVTAIAFAPILQADNYILCIGLETGALMFYKWNPSNNWQKCLELKQSEAHHLTVKRIFFRPVIGLAGMEDCGENVLQVASCSADHSVKIYNVCID